MTPGYWKSSVTTPNVDVTAFLLSPVGWLLTYAWTFACLAAVQLTVRLILRFDLRETALAALWLTLAALAVGLLYVQFTAGLLDYALIERLRGQGDGGGVGERLVQLYVMQERLRWIWLPALVLSLVSWVIGRRMLGLRPRSALLAALAMGVLLAPWPAVALA
jgi:hypothetical protein